MLDRVLLIDDAILLHKLVAPYLTNTNTALFSALDARQGLAAAETVRPSLILLDLDLPDLDGFEVCRRLKGDAHTASASVVFVSADASAANKAKALSLGAADYLAKPFTPEVLAIHVRKLIQDRHRSSANARVDSLTGMPNRALIEGRVATMLARKMPPAEPLSCVFADIDGLKSINERHGTLCGDELIRSVGALLSSECRSDDVICACGGGKFCILLKAERRFARKIARRLLSKISSRKFMVPGGPVSLTCSFGIADVSVAGKGLLERAEEALLRAKRNGKAQISVARPNRRALLSAD